MDVQPPDKRTIFEHALEFASGAEREAYLEDACAGKPEMRAQVDSLLKAHNDVGSFLDGPAFDAQRTGPMEPIAEQPGTIIGPYKLLEQIGEGGFGVVFMAEQEHPIRRRVAVKVIKPGMDTRQVIARFEAERQALALMDHPNIAHVLDAGATDSGRPYFVMELVRGVPITEFCDHHRIAVDERLKLFMAVCHAVQHAHQKGIIHRDLKPTNVLVTLHDGEPVAKVIDFGVAKATGQRLTDKTLFTAFAQMIGTPLYMSPEQTEMSGLDVDTRSDIYSLGVMLYELLTGTTPLDKERLQQAAYDEIRRIIREEEPPKPSTRISTLGATATAISTQRQSEPVKLSNLVRGELDWIVMKCLEKDRNRRFETASGLAADIERYLNDEQVLACPPSTAYRFRKFARRHKAKLATASVVAVALLFAVGSLGWAMRDRTARHAKVAGQIELILSEMEQLEREQKWAEALLAARRADAVVIGGEADAATVRRVRERLEDLEFLDRLEQIRMQRITLVDGKFDDAGADRNYARAFRDYGVDVGALAVETSIDRLKARPALVIPLAAALDDWVLVRRNVSEKDAARWKPLVAVARGIDPEPLRDRLRATWGKPDSEVLDELLRLAESIDVRAQHPATLLSLARTLRGVKQSDSALRLLRNAQYVYPGDFWFNFELGRALSEQQDHEGAIRFYTAAVSIRPSAVAAHGNLGWALSQQGKLDEAIAACRKAIEIDPRNVTAYINLGIALEHQGKLDEAIATNRKAIEVDPKYSIPHLNIALILTTCSDLKFRDTDLALTHAKKSVELDSSNPFSFNSLGVAHYRNGDYKAAIAALERSIELRKGDVSGGGFFLAMSHWQLGNKDEARRCYEKAVQQIGEPPDAHDATSDEELTRFRSEAAEVLGVNEKK
jgi:serine/threonine protein kinase/Flp pilus assembly protein TadD